VRLLSSALAVLLQVQAKQLAVSGRIFSIESARHQSKGNILRLKVNFMPEIITLAKEVGRSTVFTFWTVKIVWTVQSFRIQTVVQKDYYMDMVSLPVHHCANFYQAVTLAIHYSCP